MSELAYLAGVFDGEGSFGNWSKGKDKSKEFRASIEMSDGDVILRFLTYFQKGTVTALPPRKEGWNVDVPITSHYRQGPKRGSKRGKYKKKHLTGNAYYAAKAKKNFYYQDMGAKGGRPRIYNKITT